MGEFADARSTLRINLCVRSGVSDRGTSRSENLSLHPLDIVLMSGTTHFLALSSQNGSLQCFCRAISLVTPERERHRDTWEGRDG